MTYGFGEDRNAEPVKLEKFRENKEKAYAKNQLLKHYTEIMQILGTHVTRIRVRHDDDIWTRKLKRKAPTIQIECYDRRSYSNYDPSECGEIELSGAAGVTLAKMKAVKQEGLVIMSAAVSPCRPHSGVKSYLESKGFSPV